MPARAFQVFCLFVCWMTLTAFRVQAESFYLPEDALVLVTEGERVTALQAESGDTAWAGSFPELADGSLVRYDSERFVIAGSTAVVAFDPISGRLLWRQELPGESKWGFVSGDGTVLTGVAGSQLLALDSSTGEPVWSHPVPGRFEAAVTSTDGVFLVGVDGSSRHLVAFDWEGSFLWRQSLAPDLSQGSVVSGPEFFDDLLGLVVRQQDRDTLVAFGLDGDLRWRQALNGKLAEPISFWPTDRGLWMFVERGDRFWSLVLEISTGQLREEHAMEGVPVTWFEAAGHGFTLLERSFEEEKLDARRGEVIQDLAKGEPLTQKISGYSLVEMPAREQASWARSALEGSAELVGESFIFVTQSSPPRTPGEGWVVNRRFPEEPLVLHGFVPGTGEIWSLEPERRQDAPSKQRLPRRWRSYEGLLLLTTESGRLLAVEPLTGQIAWRSEHSFDVYLKEPELVQAGAGRVLMVSRTSAATVAYMVDSKQQGKLLWERRLTPWFVSGRLSNFIGVLLLGGAIAGFLFAARRQDLFIRKIAGLNAVDEAVGRATEMGKPVLYVTGLADVDDIQTLASLSILGHVARKTAEYDTPILVPTSRSVVLTTAQEVVKEAYTAAGRPDAYQADNVCYISDDQFGYTAGIDGMIVREKPAANFYMGTFYAESLILAETGHATGAIQVAGTAMPSQLPFFVAACDYTLIGEELYAASAYLSRDPLQVGSLRGQDVGKAILMICLVLGSLAVSLGFDFIKEWFQA